MVGFDRIEAGKRLATNVGRRRTALSESAPRGRIDRTRRIVPNHLTNRPLSSVVTDPAELALLEGRAVAQEVVLATRLIIRESTAAPRRRPR